MRRKLPGALAATLTAGTLATVGYTVVIAGGAAAVTAEQYTLRNAVVHGGGFVPGIIHNQTTKDLVYARTDIGGAYRWDPAAGRWIPLLDFLGNADWNLTGVDTLATDPVEPNRLLIVGGTYTQSWAGNAAVLRSTNRGATFTRTNLPFKMGGNENGRSMGERLQIDPNRNSVVFLGTRNDGLWRSADHGASWSRVPGFTATGQSGVGIGWITFDPASGSPGSPTRTIYAGIGAGSNSLYRSTDAGVTWSPVPGQPAAGMPHHGELSGGHIYLTYGDQPGPYTMSNGSVWKFNTASGAWTDITPVRPNSGGESGFGYAGLGVDRQHPDTVMVATMSRWGPGDDIFRSTNGGRTWVSMSARTVMDTSAAPYLDWHETPKLGWMIGDLEIDPFNSDRVLFGTGATIYGSDNVRAADSGGASTWSSRAHGLEETAVLDLISPPSGPPLISALGDIGVFRHDNLDRVPPGGMAANPIYGTSPSVDYAEAAPSVVIRVGEQSAGAHRRMAYSTDGGASWQPVATEPSSPLGGGTAAISANGARIVWVPKDSAGSVTGNRGASWSAVTGLPSGATVESDRVNPARFYAVHNGTFYVSTDGGVSFRATVSGLPAGSTKFKAVPGREGDIWLTTGHGGLYRSTNSGASFTKVGSVTQAYTVGFGRAAPGRSYQAIYLSGVIDGVDGVFRSDDTAASWVRINDDQHQYGWIGQTITGDPRVYGRVYFGTNGRGIIYGDRAGGPAPASPAPVTTVPTPAVPTPAGPPPTGGSCGVAYTVVGQWPGGFQARVRITNTGGGAISGWNLAYRFPGSQKITSIWGAGHSQSGDAVTLTNVAWNGTIGAGATVTVGFLGAGSGSGSRPVGFTLNGTACANG